MLFRYTETGQMFKKIRSGKGRYSGMFLWQPIKKGRFFHVPDRIREPFWLDDYGFEKIKGV